jgi:hypothetical protein
MSPLPADSIKERKILYYSDFDINVNDWKDEKKKLKIFASTLLERLRKCGSKSLARSWLTVLESTFGCYEVCDAVFIPGKSAWEVAIEYVTLTANSEKPIQNRISDLKDYFGAYGYIVEDYDHFKDVIEAFLSETVKVEKVIEETEKLERNFHLERKEKTFKEMQKVYNNKPVSNPYSKTDRHSYNIFNRPVTLLLQADEKIESYETVNPSQTLESLLGRLAIKEFSPAESEVKKRTTKSCYLKRSKPEIEQSVVNSGKFSAGALKVIFSYLDYGFLKFENPDFIVIGNFVTLVIEVIIQNYNRLNLNNCQS